MLAAATSGLRSNFSSIQEMVVSSGRLKSQASNPRAKKFLERSTSRPLTPLSLTASLVRVSIGTSMTR